MLNIANRCSECVVIRKDTQNRQTKKSKVLLPLNMFEIAQSLHDRVRKHNSEELHPD